MNSKCIENIISEYYRNIRTHTKCFATDINADAVHLFRVEYKKLRALLRMFLVKKQHSSKIAALKELKKIFSISGAIRDIQLQQWLVAAATKRSSQKPRAYFNFLQQQTASLKTTLAQLPIKKIIAASKAAAIESLPGKFSVNKFNTFFKTKKAEAEALIAAGNFSDEHIHAIRKILKDLYYNLKVYQKYEAAAHQPGLKEAATHYEGLLKALGLFHDKCIAISLLQPYPKKQPGKFALQQIKLSWQKEKQLMKKELVKQLTNANFLLP